MSGAISFLPTHGFAMHRMRDSSRMRDARAAARAQELINEVISEQQRAREESEKKLNLLIRRLDHLERARRELETPLLEAKYAEQARSPAVGSLLKDTMWSVCAR